MASFNVSSPSSSNSNESSPDRTPAPDSSRHTSHTGKQSLGYGFAVAWQHLRPFIPFFLISLLVVALVYLLQAIIFGGPFKDPQFFEKFNERWPRPALTRQDSPSPTKVFSTVPSLSFEQVLVSLHRGNETT